MPPNLNLFDDNAASRIAKVVRDAEHAKRNTNPGRSGYHPLPAQIVYCTVTSSSPETYHGVSLYPANTRYWDLHTGAWVERADVVYVFDPQGRIHTLGDIVRGLCIGTRDDTAFLIYAAEKVVTLDSFLAKITGAGTAGVYPFTEVSDAAGTVVTGGRSGTAQEVNGYSDTYGAYTNLLNGKIVFISQYENVPYGTSPFFFEAPLSTSPASTGGGGGLPAGSPNTVLWINGAGAAAAFTTDPQIYSVTLGVASSHTGSWTLFNAAAAGSHTVQCGNLVSTYSWTWNERTDYNKYMALRLTTTGSSGGVATGSMSWGGPCQVYYLDGSAGHDDVHGIAVDKTFLGLTFYANAAIPAAINAMAGGNDNTVCSLSLRSDTAYAVPWSNRINNVSWSTNPTLLGLTVGAILAGTGTINLTTVGGNTVAITPNASSSGYTLSPPVAVGSGTQYLTATTSGGTVQMGYATIPPAIAVGSYAGALLSSVNIGANVAATQIPVTSVSSVGSLWSVSASSILANFVGDTLVTIHVGVTVNLDAGGVVMKTNAIGPLIIHVIIWGEYVQGGLTISTVKQTLTLIGYGNGVAGALSFPNGFSASNTITANVTLADVWQNDNVNPLSIKYRVACNYVDITLGAANLLANIQLLGGSLTRLV